MPAHLIVEEGPLEGLVLEFKDKEEWTIGRDPELSDLVIEDSTASRQHLLCQKTEDGIVIKNLSTINPTLLNDLIITEPVLLKEGDRLKLGQNTFLFSEEELDTDKGKTFFDEVEEAEINPYDTIFEDAEDEPALPLNLIGDTPLLLKVLSGPNAGAEIGVEKGRSYIIGKDPNSCDIVFQDLSVSRNHARLTIEADGRCFLEDLDSKNGSFLNNKKIEDRIEINSQDLIAFGTTSILLIDRESALETIYSPQMVEPHEEVSPKKEGKKTKIPKEEWKKKPIPTKYLVSGAAFLVIFCTVFLSLFSLIHTKEVIAIKTDYSKDVTEFFKKYPEVRYTYSPATQKIFLSGNLLTTGQEQELLYLLNQKDYISEIDNQIVIDEYIWRNVNSLIASNPNWSSIRVSSTIPGQFILSGYIGTIQESEELLDFINLNFPYTSSLKNEVVVEQILTAEILSLLQGGGFQNITFQLSNGELIFAGSYLEENKSSLDKILTTLAKAPGIINIRNLTVGTTADTARIDLSNNYRITGISYMNNKVYSVVINGKIYTQDDLLDGMTISSLEPDVILLRSGALRYRIEYSL